LLRQGKSARRIQVLSKSGQTLLMPDFRRVVLAPHAAVSPPDGARLPDKPNRLRIAPDSFWKFQEIDTDRIPRGRQAA